MLSRQHRGLLLRDEGPHRSSLESHVTQAARLFRAGGRRKLTRALGGRKDSGDSLGFFLPHVTSDLKTSATGNANGYKQKPPTKVALSGAGEPSKTSGQELPSSSKHPENLAPQPRLQSLPGSLDPHPPGGAGTCHSPQGGVREASTFTPAGGRRASRPTGLRGRPPLPSTSGGPRLPRWLVPGDQGESELAPPPTSSRPPWRSRGHPHPASQEVSVGAEWGFTPQQWGAPPLAADEAEGNLEFFPDLAVTSTPPPWRHSVRESQLKEET